MDDLPHTQRPGAGRGGRGGDNTPRDTVPSAGGGQGGGQRSGGGD
jgi:hypothetical protein